MILPPGFISKQPGQVCRLKRSLYGLKQASRQWNARLTTELISMGFKQAVCDNSLFTRGSNDSFIALLVYVDDVVLASSDKAQIQQIKEHLHLVFKIKDLGSLKYFLGLEVARKHTCISLTQRKYALDLLQDSGFLETKPAKCPMVQTNKLSKDDGEALEDNTQYRRLVGKLLYLNITKPDISFAVQQLSQFLDKPTTIHLQAVHRVLRYIKICPGQGLFFPTDFNLKMSGFADSDWAACPDTRKSVTGFFLEVQLGEAVVLFSDSISAIAIAENPVLHERTKHIEIDCHLIRENVQKGTIKLLHVPIEHQTANILTKPLQPMLFQKFVSKLGLHSMYTPACGEVLEEDGS
ncbi:PREDICTED: uncharacterized protein LOC109168445 [Ipomoea nil]|uniref:uncharacterized protein LOC109168445 n=1 Tax=Ipomoea nil TaxID=35883 RepID=UPI000900C655|nr:PREDICTED: uncharacterized protein LOC109168445 [Ipomoea nil]